MGELIASIASDCSGYYYITYIATVEAMKALNLCGELDAIVVDTK